MLNRLAAARLERASSSSMLNRLAAAGLERASSSLVLTRLAFESRGERLAALRSRRFCQLPGVVMMFVGYASTSWGDEYIGPHADEDKGLDPALTYSHVRERLDGWAAVCENCTRKVSLLPASQSLPCSRHIRIRSPFLPSCSLLSPTVPRTRPAAAAILQPTQPHRPTHTRPGADGRRLAVWLLSRLRHA